MGKQCNHITMCTWWYQKHKNHRHCYDNRKWYHICANPSIGNRVHQSHLAMSACSLIYCSTQLKKWFRGHSMGSNRIAKCESSLTMCNTVVISMPTSQTSSLYNRMEYCKSVCPLDTAWQYGQNFKLQEGKVRCGWDKVLSKVSLGYPWDCN